MTLHKFTVTIPHDSGLPEDSIVNGWHFFTSDPIITDFDNVRDMLADFYTLDGEDQTNALVAYYSGVYGGPAVVKGYDLSDPEPRTPVYMSDFAFNPPTLADALPSEVAIVLSFGASPASGTPAARRRNRVYLGPLNSDVLGGNGLVGGGAVSDIATAARNLHQAQAASANWDWNGYSPTDDVAFQVVGGWVDNAFDTQRRRGVSPTNRVFFDNETPA